MYVSFRWDRHLFVLFFFCLLVAIFPSSSKETLIFLWGNHSSYSELSVSGSVDSKPNIKVQLWPEASQSVHLLWGAIVSGKALDLLWASFPKALILLILFCEASIFFSAVVADRIRCRPKAILHILFPMRWVSL